MTEHPIMHFAEALKDLAEGRTEPAAWMEWWAVHAAKIESVAKPGWFLQLKPKGAGTGNSFQPIVASHNGACYVLEAIGVPFTRSDRYTQAWQAEFDRYCAEQRAKEAEKVKAFTPAITSLTAHFPKFGRFLKKRVADIHEMEPPALDAQIAQIEGSIAALPTAYKTFLRCTAGLWIEGLDLRSHQLFVHQATPGQSLPTDGMLCFGEYALEADGDQVLFQMQKPDADPPVYYYSHESAKPSVKQIGKSFTAWIESLPRSPIFK